MATNTTHDVYEHPDGRREIIKKGFSWPAFVLGPLWAWRNGMGVVGFRLLALGLVLPLIPVIFIDVFAEASIAVDLILTVSVLTWIGGQGNAWLRNSVLSRGFKLAEAATTAEGGTVESGAIVGIDA